MRGLNIRLLRAAITTKIHADNSVPIFTLRTIHHYDKPTTFDSFCSRSTRKYGTLQKQFYQNFNASIKKLLLSRSRFSNNMWPHQMQRRYSGSTKENDLLQHLKKRITMAGPLTVADYMKEVLTNPLSVSQTVIIFQSFGFFYFNHCNNFFF